MTAEPAPCIQARRLRKSFGAKAALDGVDLRVECGGVLGLIGANGAGKSTALNAIMGLIPHEGELSVLGLDPWTQRDALMREACFIADVVVLPRWMRVWQALDYVAGVHPRFDRAKAQAFLAQTTIGRTDRVSQLSKGMGTQLNLALIISIDAKLLVLDEPTLGLDVIYRKAFYDRLLGDYFDQSRTIVVATHHLDEVEHILTDVVFLRAGRVLLSASMEALAARYVELTPRPETLSAARGLAPIQERTTFGRSVLLFDGVDRARLAPLGELRTPSLSDLFVALNDAAGRRGAA